MSEVRTMKDGELYVLINDQEKIINDTGVTGLCGFVASDGTRVVLAVDSSGDLIRFTGNDFLTLGTGAGSVVLNATHAIVSPQVAVSGSNVHLWYGYDSAGGTAYTVYYALSTDAGATWGTPGEVIALGSGGTWNDESMRPAGAYYSTADSKVYLHVNGYDGASYALGQFSIDTGDDFTNSVNYDAHASNALFPANGSLGSAACVVYGKGTYHLYAAPSATEVYYAESQDGIRWGPRDFVTSAPRLARGIDTTDDDTAISPSGAYFDGEWFWMFYTASDGATGRAFLALGEVAEYVWKVRGLKGAALTGNVYYALGNLSYAASQGYQHVGDRGKAGALLCAPFTPFTGAFGFLHQKIGTDGTVAAGGSDTLTLFLNLISPSQSVNEGPSNFETHEPETFHLLYTQTNGAAALEQFTLFLKVKAEFDYSEEDDGTTINVPFTSFGATKPYRGLY